MQGFNPDWPPGSIQYQKDLLRNQGQDPPLELRVLPLLPPCGQRPAPKAQPGAVR